MNTKYENIIKLLALKEQSEDKDFVQKLIDQEEERLNQKFNGILQIVFDKLFENSFNSYDSKPRYDEENLKTLEHYRNFSFKDFRDECKDEYSRVWGETDKQKRNDFLEVMFEMFKEKVNKDYEAEMKFAEEGKDEE